MAYSIYPNIDEDAAKKAVSSNGVKTDDTKNEPQATVDNAQNYGMEEQTPQEKVWQQKMRNYYANEAANIFAEQAPDMMAADRAATSGNWVKAAEHMSNLKVEAPEMPTYNDINQSNEKTELAEALEEEQATNEQLQEREERTRDVDAPRTRGEAKAKLYDTVEKNYGGLYKALQEAGLYDGSIEDFTSEITTEEGSAKINGLVDQLAQQEGQQREQIKQQNYDDLVSAGKYNGTREEFEQLLSTPEGEEQARQMYEEMRQEQTEDLYKALESQGLYNGSLEQFKLDAQTPEGEKNINDMLAKYNENVNKQIEDYYNYVSSLYDGNLEDFKKELSTPEGNARIKELSDQIDEQNTQEIYNVLKDSNFVSEYKDMPYEEFKQLMDTKEGQEQVSGFLDLHNINVEVLNKSIAEQRKQNEEARQQAMQKALKYQKPEKISLMDYKYQQSMQKGAVSYVMNRGDKSGEVLGTATRYSSDPDDHRQILNQDTTFTINGKKKTYKKGSIINAGPASNEQKVARQFNRLKGDVDEALKAGGIENAQKVLGEKLFSGDGSQIVKNEEEANLIYQGVWAKFIEGDYEKMVADTAGLMDEKLNELYGEETKEDLKSIATKLLISPAFGIMSELMKNDDGSTSEFETLLNENVNQFAQSLKKYKLAPKDEAEMIADYRMRAMEHMIDYNTNSKIAERVAGDKVLGSDVLSLDLQGVVKSTLDVIGGARESLTGKVLFYRKKPEFTYMLDKATSLKDAMNMDEATSIIRGTVAFFSDYGIIKGLGAVADYGLGRLTNFTAKALDGYGKSSKLVRAVLPNSWRSDNAIARLMSSGMSEDQAIQKFLSARLSDLNKGKSLCFNMYKESATGGFTFGNMGFAEGVFDESIKPVWDKDRDQLAQSMYSIATGMANSHDWGYCRENIDNGMLETFSRVMNSGAKHGFWGTLSGAVFIGGALSQKIGFNRNLAYKFLGDTTKLGINAAGMTSVQMLEQSAEHNSGWDILWGVFDEYSNGGGKAFVTNLLSLGILDAIGIAQRSRKYSQIREQERKIANSPERDNLADMMGLPKNAMEVLKGIADGTLELPETTNRGFGYDIDIFENPNDPGHKSTPLTAEQKKINEQLSNYFHNGDIPQDMRAELYSTLTGRAWRFSRPTSLGDVKMETNSDRYKVDLLDDEGNVVTTHYYDSQEDAVLGRVKLDRELQFVDMQDLSSLYQSRISQATFGGAVQKEYDALAKRRKAYDKVVKRMNKVGKKGLKPKELEILNGFSEHEKDLMMFMDNEATYEEAKRKCENGEELKFHEREVWDAGNRLFMEHMENSTAVNDIIKAFEESSKLEPGTIERIKDGYEKKKDALTAAEKAHLEKKDVIKVGDKWYTMDDVHTLREFRETLYAVNRAIEMQREAYLDQKAAMASKSMEEVQAVEAEQEAPTVEQQPNTTTEDGEQVAEQQPMTATETTTEGATKMPTEGANEVATPEPVVKVEPESEPAVGKKPYAAPETAVAPNEGSSPVDAFKTRTKQSFETGKAMQGRDRTRANRRFEQIQKELEKYGSVEQIKTWLLTRGEDRVFELMQNHERPELVQEFVDSFNQIMGMRQAIQEEVNEASRVSDAFIDEVVSRNGFVTSLELADGRTVFLKAGNLAVASDGTVIAGKSDRSVFVYDSNTGKSEQLSPEQIRTASAIRGTDAKVQSQQRIKDAIIERHDKEIEGRLDMQPGEVVDYVENGEKKVARIMANNGDGTVQVDFDGKIKNVRAEDVQKMHDDFLDGEIAEERKPVEPAPVEQQKPADNRVTYGNNDNVDYGKTKPEDMYDMLEEQSKGNARVFAEQRLEEAKKALEEVMAKKPTGKSDLEVMRNNAALIAERKQAEQAVKFWEDVLKTANEKEAPIVTAGAEQPAAEGTSPTPPVEQSAPAEPVAPAVPTVPESPVAPEAPATPEVPVTNKGEQYGFSAEDLQKISGNTKATQTVAKLMDQACKNMNLKAVVFDDPANTHVNGYIKDGVIYINSRGAKPFAFVLGHEMTHEMQAKSPEIYESFRKMAVDRYFKEGNFGDKDSYLRKTEKVYADQVYDEAYNNAWREGKSEKECESIGKAEAAKITRDFVLDEIAADMAGEILSSRKNAEEVFKPIEENAQDPNALSTYAKIKNVVMEYLDKIAQMLGFKDSGDTEFVALRNSLAELYRDSIKNNRGNLMQDSGIRYSIDTQAQSVGMKWEKDAEGKSHFYEDLGNGRKGREINTFRPVHIANSPMGAMLKQALMDGVITGEMYNKTLQNQASILQMMKDTNNLDEVFAVSGAIAANQLKPGQSTVDLPAEMRDAYVMDENGKVAFIPYKTNSETQYNTTWDVTTICRKTQTAVDVMSETMKKLKRGLTPDEVIDIVYKNIYQMSDGAIPVPCNVCYVFNRWVNLGTLFETMRTLRDMYPETMTKEQVADARNQAIDELIGNTGLKMTKKQLTSYKNKLAELKVAEKSGDQEKIKKIKADIEAAEYSNKVAQIGKKMAARLEELNWKEFNYTHGTKKGARPLTANERAERDQIIHELPYFDKVTWFDYVRLQDDYTAIPDEVLFDINASTEFKRDYAGAWKYRTTRGSGMGKAAAAYAPEYFGTTVVARATNAKDATDLSKNVFLTRNEDGTYKYINPDWTLKPEAVVVMRKAQDAAAAQNFYNGMRLQSTSDARPEYMTDYNLHFIEQMCIGSKEQGFTKVPECARMIADVGTGINFSLIGKDKGYEELTREQYNALDAEDKRDCVELDGKIYHALYSDISGINHRDAMALNDAYDNAQNIMVCLSPLHGRIMCALAARGRVTFNIPWHASGDTAERFASKTLTVGEILNTKDRLDATDYQEDKDKANMTAEEKTARATVVAIKTGNELSADMVDLLKKAKAEGENSKYNIIRQMYMRFRGEDIDGSPAKIQNKFLRPEDRDTAGEGYGKMDSQCRIRVWDPKTGEYLTDEKGNPLYKQIVFSSKQAELLMPNDYWDNLTTLETADRNGDIFVQYADSLGYVPRFTGMAKGKTYKADGWDLYGNGQYKGYWTTLIDTAMYGRDGQRYFQRPVDASTVNSTHFGEQAKELNKDGVQRTLTPALNNPGIEELKPIIDKSASDVEARRVQDEKNFIELVKQRAASKARGKFPWAKVSPWIQQRWLNDPEFAAKIGKETGVTVEDMDRTKLKEEQNQTQQAVNQELSGGDKRYSLRVKPDPTKTEKVYKLMRLGEDGNLYPLYIDASAPILIDKWYDADSPNLDMLKDKASGVWLVNDKNGEVVSYDDFFAEHKDLFSRGKQSKFPSVAAINWATDNGLRFMYIEDTERAQKRFEGEKRKYWNLGINGSGAVSTFSMRPGWHAGSLPTMRQIGSGPNKDKRDDTFVWVEGEVSADKNYQAEADANPDKDIPDRIPEDGFYLKATNADKAKSQADVVGWYVAGAFKPNRIMSDHEARKIIDDWNAEHPGQNVEYDYERVSGKVFNAETMQLEDVTQNGPDDPNGGGKRYSLGVPYQGSKNKYAADIMSVLPEGSRFVDLFSGGGAMTHAAMLSGKYDTYHMNDKFPMGQNLFIGGIEGKYRDYDRRVNAEEFKEMRFTPEGIMHSYSGYGRNVANDAEGRSKQGEQIKRVQALEQLNPMRDKLSSSELDYRDVEIKPGDVLYADIPYANEDVSAYRNAGKFDHKAFSEWATNLDQPVFVSSYEAPEGFTEIWSSGKATKNGKVEKLFVQDKFAEEYKQPKTVGEKRYSLYKEELYNDAKLSAKEKKERWTKFVENSYEITSTILSESGVKLDKLGNPVDEEGQFIAVRLKNVNEITEDDIETPSRNIILPTLDASLLSALGAGNKDVLIKRNVFAKNSKNHPELSTEASVSVLRNSLYQTYEYGQSKPITNPDYKVVLYSGKDSHDITVLDVKSTKDNLEVVGWRTIDDSGLQHLKNQAIKEGGQFLILTPQKGPAEDLSALQNDLISDGKVTDNISNGQTNLGKSEKKFSLTVDQKEQVKGENFKKWFGDWEKNPAEASKVVDENGEPLVVYHGASLVGVEMGEDGNTRLVNKSKFYQFRDGKGFFTDSRQAAEGFTSRTEELYECYLDIKNPLVIDAKGADWDRINLDGRLTTADAIVSEAKESGEYDGVIINNVRETESGMPNNLITDYIPFKAEQIKSATQNNGEFSKTNPDIRYSLNIPVDGVGSHMRMRVGESRSEFLLRQQMYQQGIVGDAEEARKRTIEQIQTQIDRKQIGSMGKRDLKELLTRVKEATPENLVRTLKDAQHTLNTLQGRVIEQNIASLLKTKLQKKNQRGMSIHGRVNEGTARVMQGVKTMMNDIFISGLEEDRTNLIREQRELNKTIREAQARIDAGATGQELADLQQTVADATARKEQTKTEMETLQQEMDTAKAKKVQVTKDEVQARITELMSKYDEFLNNDGEWTEHDTEQLMGYNIVNERLAMIDAQAQVSTLNTQMANIQLQIEAKKQQYNPGWGKSAKDAYKAELAQLENDYNATKDMATDAQAEANRRGQEVADKISELLKGGYDKLKSQIETERNRQRDIIFGVWGDFGKTSNAMRALNQSQQERKDAEKPSKLRQVFNGVMGSFEYMAQHISKFAGGKDSYFYKRFVEGPEGVIAAQNENLRNQRASFQEMNQKCEEIFGKKYMKVMKDNEKVVENTGIFKEVMMNGMPVSIPVAMSKGQATYMYMVWKMPDGRAKLEKMGFTEESIARAEEFIGEQNKRWADWVQEEFLVKLRGRYNETYRSLFNTSMADIPNYVPLKIENAMRKQDVDVAQINAPDTLNQKTGSLINRTFNLNPVDLTNSAYSVIAEHIKNMEEWNAFARVRQDLNYVLSSTAIRNQLNENQAGEFERLKKACQIATHTYNVDVPDASQWINILTRGLAGANIAFRNTTALKQTLSLPAFLGYNQDPVFMGMLLYNTLGQYARNSPGIAATMLSLGEFGRRAMRSQALDDKPNWTAKMALSGSLRWCVENIPSFRDRIAKGGSGNVVLDEMLADDKTWHDKVVARLGQNGMAANAYIDAVTCAIGLKTIYDYRKWILDRRSKKLHKDGVYTDEELDAALADNHRKALTEAEVFVNSTQQSNHPAFLAPVQMDGDVASKLFTLYKNSPISYARKAILSAEEIGRLMNYSKMRNKLIEDYIAKGYTPEQAETRASRHMTNNVLKSMVGVALFGYGLNWLWNEGGQGLLGLLQSEDDDKKKEKPGQFIVDMAEKTAPVLNGVPGVDLLMNTLQNKEMNPLLLFDLQNDIVTDAKRNGWLSKDVAYDILNSFSRVGLGIDLNTATNTILAAEHLYKTGITGDNKAKLIDYMLLMNTPNSNRKQVARKVYMDDDVDTFLENILMADKLIKDEDSWKYYAPGVRVATQEQIDAILKEYAEAHATEWQKAMAEKKKNGTPEKLLEAYETRAALKTEFENETDPERKINLGKAYVKALEKEAKVNQSTQEHYREVFEKMFPTDADVETINAQKAYIKGATIEDVVSDDKLKLKIGKYSEISDSLQQMKYRGDAASLKKYVESHREEIKNMKILEAYQGAISKLKRGIMYSKDEKQKAELMMKLRELQEKALNSVN